jgi:hypothetical protein
MRLSIVKRTVMATALAVATAVAGVAGQAQAFSFGENDLVLAIYGNNTEALVNLGNANTVLAPGGAGISNLNLSAALAAAGVGTNPVKYTIFGHDSNLGSLYAGTAFPSTAINPNQLGLTVQFEASIAMQALGGFTGDTVSKSDPKSFFSNLNQNGAGNMGGTWPVAMQGGLDQILNVMKGDVNTNTFTQVGRVLLTSTGLLTIGNPGPAAVPLPAGVVLFGTGIIALVGIARRSFKRMAA